MVYSLQHEHSALSWVASRLSKLVTADQIQAEVASMQTIALGPDTSPFDRDFYHLRIREAAHELSGVLDRNGAAAVWAVVLRWQTSIRVRRG